MINNNTTYKVNKKKRRLVILILLAFTLVTVAGSLQIYAIYYDKQNTRSVAVLKESYFTSNYLKEGNSFDTVYNKTRWDGEGACTFDIEIRNYANMLLVNDKDLDITYTLSFQLMEDPGEGNTYAISYNDKEVSLTYNTKSNGQGDIVTTDSLVLSGGEVKDQKVNLKVYKGKDASQSVPVKVWASISSPSYLKNDYALSASLVASVDAGEFDCSGHFEVMGILNAADWKDNLKKAAGFKYTVSTSGGNDIEDYKIKITWDPMLTLYQYDKNERVTGENAILVTTKTNSSFTLVFFRGDNFDAGINELNSIGEFTDLIQISRIENQHSGE